MAYNPFSIFRRNQKAIFAVVTVIIMFVFVMSSGLGRADFFDWLPRWLGTKNQQGEVMCKLDGSKVYSSELYNLRLTRAMANRFMVLAASEAVQNIEQDQTQNLTKLPASEIKQRITQGKDAVSQMRFFAQFAAQLGPQVGRMIRQAELQVQDCFAVLSMPSATQAEKDFVRTMMYQQMLDDVLMRSRGQLYFLRSPNQTDSDQLNFLLWQKKADQLGIKFTDADLGDLIKNEFHGYFKDDRPVRKEMAQFFSKFDMETCLRAIAEEFRVRTAQLAVLGPGLVYAARDTSFNPNAMFTSPYDFFEFYRDQCSPTDYGVVSVPEEAFLSKVSGEPTEKELRAIYDEGSKIEPHPARETPGFKTPRMEKLEWVSASGEEPYYKKLAEEGLKAGENQWKAGSFLTVPLPGSGPGWAAVATAPLVLKDPLLSIDSVRNEYERDIQDIHNAAMRSDWQFPSFVTRFLDTSVARPETVAATLGGLVGGSLTGAGPLSGIGSFEVAVRAAELRDRIRAQAPLFLGAVPGPSLFATLMGGEAAMRSLLPKPVPIEAARPELMKHLAEHTARQLMLADLKTFTTEMAKIGNPKTEAAKEKKAEPKTNPAELKAAVEKYVAEYTAKRGWKRGGSTKLESEWTLEDDPGLAPLKEAFVKIQHGSLPIQFGERFFWKRGQGNQAAPATGLYQPEDYPRAPSPFESPSAKTEPTFLVWRSEETKAKEAEPFDYKPMQDKLKAAWKRLKARELARAKADEIAAAVRASAGDSQALIEQTLNEQANTLRAQITDPKVKDKVKVFQLPNVCPLTFTFDPSSPQPRFGPFTMRPTTDIPFPTQTMLNTLLEERTKPTKTTFVQPDNPKDTYYVFALEGRRERTLEEFRLQVYSEPSPQPMQRQDVLASFDADLQRQTMESIYGLLKQEFRFEITDEQKKKLEENDKKGMETNQF